MTAPARRSPVERSAVPPALVVITDRDAAARAGRSVPQVVAAALDGGAPAILLRDKDLPAAARRSLGMELASLTTDAGARLLVASDARLARELGADGVHLAAADPPCPAPVGLLGRSCHDHDEVVAARTEGAAYAFVSPVAASGSKPGYGPVLGSDGVRELVDAAGELPLLALGGVTPANAARWREAGAYGLAVMGGVMEAIDPMAAVAALLDAWAVDPDAPAS